MNNKDNKYIFDDDENDDLEIAEYLERELDDMAVRENRQRPKRAASVAKKTGVDTFKTKEKKTVKKPKFILHYEKNKLNVLWCTLGVLIVILIVALIITNVSKDDKSLEAPEESTNIAEDNSEDESTDAAEDNTEDSAEDNTSFEPEATDSVYNQLCEKYLRSIYVEWDDETLSEICDSTQNLSKDDYSFYNKYIEDIENVNCYIGYETDDGKLLVLVTYNMKFVNISTSAPDMVAVVLVKSDDGEGYLIHNLEVEDEVYFYTSDLQNSQGYIDLCEEIRNQLSEALASDENLQKVYDIIKGMSE